MTAGPRNTLGRPGQGQQGVALVVALVMLVVILILGLSAMRLAATEERMAGYALDRQLAFQAAEAALRQIEERVDDERPDAGPACADILSGGITALRVCPAPAGAASPRWITINAADWGDATAVGPAGAQITPRYLIEHLGSNFACDAAATAAQTCRRYRITVRAGGAPRAEVMLQSIYLTD